MKKRRDKGGKSREELEKEAAAELRARSGGSGPPPGPWSPPAGYGAPGASGPAAPGPSGYGPSPGPPPRPRAGPAGRPGDDDEDSPHSTEEAITELALQQLAERRGGASLEDLAIPWIDPTSAEAMRDRAMAQFQQRQAELAQQRAALRARLTAVEPERRPGGSEAPARKAAAKKSVAKKAPAKKAPAKKAPAKKSATKAVAKAVAKAAPPARKTAKKAATAERPAAKKAAVVKKAVLAKKAGAKKAKTVATKKTV